MAKILKEDKTLEVDLNNLTREDFMEMARYIQHLEEQLEGAKTTGIALVGQRNILQKKVEQMAFTIRQMQLGVNEIVTNTVIDTDFDLVNPEQYRIKG
jgi:two-component sensor histidine kinase